MSLNYLKIQEYRNEGPIQTLWHSKDDCILMGYEYGNTRCFMLDFRHTTSVTHIILITN